MRRFFRGDEVIQNRINEIVVEFSEYREDERNTQSQILETISVVGTILDILSRASYLYDKQEVFLSISMHCSIS